MTMVTYLTRIRAAWRCRCRYDDSNAHWVTSGCLRHGTPRPGTLRAAATWADVIALGCLCRWKAVAAGWVIAERTAGCRADHRDYAEAGGR